ncbi:hypothetical protein FNL37_1798 [Methylovorus glucosotrophus]|uniref:zinc ribbon domain-containing protein n=1 Tax=Methylovorus glucosotrophus TaxID=266009 RepID=UPI001331C3A6|nr:zinc ribbon domain-containing protein [Methylovorus glucosotrophus]KAF0844354.1 hypothetical protein FNL37_1798 [Methylovorus glucosotrophus]
MALIKCKECKSQISSKAKVCPNCGAPVKKEATLLGCLTVFLLVGFVIFLFSDGDKETATSTSEAKQECASDDLSCLGNKGILSASVYCQDPVERLAKYSMKWTDGILEPKFSRFMWKDKNKGEITYIGDKAQFQNGFGAFMTVIYECDMANDNKTVIGARVTEGRLP